MKRLGLIIAVMTLAGMAYGCGSDPSVIDESTAAVICKNKVESVAKYETDFSAFDVDTLENADHWLVKVPGKMQNGFGAWKKVVGYCRVAKKNPDPTKEFNPEAIMAFEVQE